VSTDIDGEPRLGVPDLGADEHWAPGALKRVYLPVNLRSYWPPGAGHLSGGGRTGRRRPSREVHTQ
jgi:hypothetical protein